MRGSSTTLYRRRGESNERLIINIVVYFVVCYLGTGGSSERLLPLFCFPEREEGVERLPYFTSMDKARVYKIGDIVTPESCVLG